MIKSFRSILFLELASLLLAAMLSVFTALHFSNKHRDPGVQLPTNYGQTAGYQYMKYLSELYPMRVCAYGERVGRYVYTQEKAAGEYLAKEFRDMGYDVQVQGFIPGTQDKYFDYTNPPDEDLQTISANIIATKPGRSQKKLIIAAHLDDATPTNPVIEQGTSDNASGVGLLLWLAKSLQSADLPYSLTFIAFGCEENNLSGSRAYNAAVNLDRIEHLDANGTGWIEHRVTDAARDTIGMINLDSIAGGDKLYVYSGKKDFPHTAWLRDRALQIASQKEIALETSPGLNPSYPAGTTGDWGDSAPFQLGDLNIPFAYFEATNWEIGDKDGYTQTDRFGSFWHTGNDTLAYIESRFPGRMEKQIIDMYTVIMALLQDPQLAAALQ